MNTPNALTLLRILLIPVLALCYLLPFGWAPLATVAVFILAGVTDLLDGYLARLLNQSSSFGAFLDPVADKLVVVTALVLLVSDQTLLDAVLNRTLFVLVVAIIVGRELVISALRERMAELGSSRTVAVSYAGKIKTVGQFIAIAMLLYREPLLDISMLRLGEILLGLAAVLTLWSMTVYLRAAWSDLFDGRGTRL